MVERATQGILIVEDNTEDYIVAQRILRRVTDCPIIHCINGESALDYLLRRGAYSDAQYTPPPALVLLDLNLPGTDGREILRHIKQDAHLQSIPVVVLTTSANPYDVA